MGYEHLSVSTVNHVMRVTLERPEVLNAINVKMHEELQMAFDDFAVDDNKWICVVIGSGDRAFCAGSDLKAIARNEGPTAYPKNGYAGLIERYDLDKPVIAAVDGIAVGGGFEVALACDIILATRRSVFGLPEPLIGRMALGGGVHRLARQIGLKQAMGMILGSESVSAQKALDMGIVTDLIEDGEIETAINSWVTKILKCAPLSVRASKQAVLMGLDEASLEEALKKQTDYPAFVKMINSSDADEGPLAFAQKRAPDWKGR
jgi:enoyl-CoA hydratase/carnithine racemase